MQVAVIGYTGFVGSHLANEHPTADLYNSSNCADICGKHYNIIYCAGQYAVKWWANANPNEDHVHINTVLDVIKKVTCDTFVLYSTIDVYETPEKEENESQTEICSERHHAYGRHRREFEIEVQKHFGVNVCHIIRLPGLFGFGLKKNIIFDLIHHKVTELDVRDTFQWYAMEWLANDTQYAIKNRIPVLNVFPEPISNQLLLDIANCHFTHKVGILYPHPNDNPVQYNCTTIYGHSSKYWKPAIAVTSALHRYLRAMINPYLCISSLALQNNSNGGDWNDCTEKMNLITSRYGIKKVEIAPYAYFGRDFMSRDLAWFGQFRDNHIYSFQGLFYPNKFNMFTQGTLVMQYFKKLVDIADVVEATILVFGSPIVRQCDPKDMINEHAIALAFFKEISDYIGDRNITIAIEHNASKYGCNFLITPADVISFVRNVNRKNIQMVLDTGCAYMEGVSIKDAIEDCINSGFLAHVHFSMPHLTSFSNDGRFATTMFWMRFFGYTGFVTLELVNISRTDLERAICVALEPPAFNIVGAGWFGCHLATVLKEQGLHVDLYEQLSLFNGASGFNQNRLHMGYHYPRSYDTRNMCITMFQRFIQRYGKIVHTVKKNIYAISKYSCIDAATYEIIMKSLGLAVQRVDPSIHGIHACETAYITDERFIDNEQIKLHFENTLSDCIQYAAYNKTHLYSIWPCIVQLDCSNGNLLDNENTENVFTLVLLYKIRDFTKACAITIMDGPFASLYPQHIDDGIFSLTHVKHGIINEKYPTKDLVLRQQMAMENDFKQYYPQFCTDFEFTSYVVSNKRLRPSSSASRDVVINHTPGGISFTSGKIAGIFVAEDMIHIALI